MYDVIALPFITSSFSFILLCFSLFQVVRQVAMASTAQNHVDVHLLRVLAILSRAIVLARLVLLVQIALQVSSSNID